MFMLEASKPVSIPEGEREEYCLRGSMDSSEDRTKSKEALGRSPLWGAWSLHSVCVVCNFFKKNISKLNIKMTI